VEFDALVVISCKQAADHHVEEVTVLHYPMWRYYDISSLF